MYQNGSKLFDTVKVFLKYFFEKKLTLKKSEDDNKSMKNYTACKELILKEICVGIQEHACLLG